VVEEGLERFADQVELDALMDRLSKRIDDERDLPFSRRCSEAVTLEHGRAMECGEGKPQGGPLSTMPTHVRPDEVDQELEERARAFVHCEDG